MTDDHIARLRQWSILTFDQNVELSDDLGLAADRIEALEAELVTANRVIDLLMLSRHANPAPASPVGTKHDSD